MDPYKQLAKLIQGTQKKHKKTLLDYHKLIYDTEVWKLNKWMGYTVWKTPMDLWMLQEIIFEIKPQLIIETGTAHGGSALYMASLLELIYKDNLDIGGVISIDIDKLKISTLPKHPRIQFITANSVDPRLVNELEQNSKGFAPVLVVLDSDHSTAHVYKELVYYSDIVTRGSFLIVEDTNLGIIVRTDEAKKLGIKEKPENIGPGAAVRKFLKETDKFKVHPLCERFFVSFNPGGFLCKVKD